MSGFTTLPATFAENAMPRPMLKITSTATTRVDAIDEGHERPLALGRRLHVGEVIDDDLLATGKHLIALLQALEHLARRGIRLDLLGERRLGVLATRREDAAGDERKDEEQDVGLTTHAGLHRPEDDPTHEPARRGRPS